MSYYATHLPEDFHKFSVFMTFFIEIICPFLLWLGWIPYFWIFRYIGWLFFNGLLAMIILTGNYGFIGVLNLIENISCSDDSFWYFILPITKT